MIARAYITAIDYSNWKLQVRIPILDGVESKDGVKDSDLSWASILAIPGIEVNYKVGDVVFVGFEDNNKGKPVVLGYLKSAIPSNPNNLTENFPSLKVNSIEVISQANFPIDTIIGKTEYNKIFNSIEKMD